MQIHTLLTIDHRQTDTGKSILSNRTAFVNFFQVQATELIVLIREDWRENPAQHGFCQIDLETCSGTLEFPGVFWQVVLISIAKGNNDLGRDHYLDSWIGGYAGDDLLSTNQSCLLHVSPGREVFKQDRFWLLAWFIFVCLGF